MNSAQLSQFIAFAATKHRHQKRKGSGLPFIVHPLSVMRRMTDDGITDPAVLAVAVGHDLIEDTGATVSQIKNFLEETGIHPKEADWIVNRIFELSNVKERKLKDTADYFGRMSQEALLVKTYDAIDNLTDTLKDNAANQNHYTKYCEYFDLINVNIKDSKYSQLIEMRILDLSHIIAEIFASGASNHD